MTHLISCIARLNETIVDRTFPSDRIPTPAEAIGIVQIKTAIILLQNANASFAMSDAFFGEPSWERLADFLEEVQRREEIQKDIDQTSWGAEHELERLHDLSPSEVWKVMARVALKCMGTE